MGGLLNNFVLVTLKNDLSTQNMLRRWLSNICNHFYPAEFAAMSQCCGCRFVSAYVLNQALCFLSCMRHQTVPPGLYGPVMTATKSTLGLCQ